MYGIAAGGASTISCAAASGASGMGGASAIYCTAAGGASAIYCTAAGGAESITGALVPALAMWKGVLLHHTVFSVVPVHHCSIMTMALL